MMFFSIAEFVVLLLALALEVFAQTYPPNDDGVINPLGLGQEYVPLNKPSTTLADLIGFFSPAPVRWYNTTSKQNVYLFPDVDFNRTVWLRVSTNLSDVQYDLRGNSLSLSPSHGNPYGCLMKLWTDHTVFVFPNSIATEAPDISQTADKKW